MSRYRVIFRAGTGESGAYYVQRKGWLWGWNETQASEDWRDLTGFTTETLAVQWVFKQLDQERRWALADRVVWP